MVHSLIISTEIRKENQLKKLNKLYEKVKQVKNDCEPSVFVLSKHCCSKDQFKINFNHYSLHGINTGSTFESNTIQNTELNGTAGEIESTPFCTKLIESNFFGFMNLSNNLKIAFINVPLQPSTESLNSLQNVSIKNVDLLLSYQWPVDVDKKSELAVSKDISSHLTAPNTIAQSKLINQLIFKCNPRYHFAFGDSPIFFEREPYKYQDTITRFIGLASGDSNDKSLYAFNLKSVAESSAPTGMVTSCPYQIMKRAANDDYHEESFFWNDASRGSSNNVKRIKKDDIDGIPPEGYVCRVCHIAGHYVHKCPENTKSVPDGYLCRICGIPGHYIRDCPKAEERTKTSKALKKRDLSLCWFCLSNPSVESHMILGIVNDCYVASAKGSLTEDHILIVPIVHHANMSTLLKSEIDQDGEESVTKEIHDIYKKVRLVQKEKGNAVVYFEVFGGGDPSNPSVRLHHMHINLIPIPLDMVESLETEFEKQALDQGLIRSKTLPENVSWPFVRLGFGGGKEEVIYSPPVPPPGRSLTPFHLAFARQVIANILGVPEKTNWKKCVVEAEEEAAITDRIRKEYPFLLE